MKMLTIIFHVVRLLEDLTVMLHIHVQGFLLEATELRSLATTTGPTENGSLLV